MTWMKNKMTPSWLCANESDKMLLHSELVQFYFAGYPSICNNYWKFLLNQNQFRHIFILEIGGLMLLLQQYKWGI